MEIRKAEFEDITSLIDVNIRTWQTAYFGIIDSKTLEALDISKNSKIESYRESFGKKDVDGVIIQEAVAIEKKEIVGFVTFGKYRDELKDKVENACEIYAIYVLEEYHGKQIGKKLIHFAVNELRKDSKYDNLKIWTLKENKSKGFYEALGGKKSDEKVIEINGQNLKEVCYSFKDLEELKFRTKDIAEKY